jgi:inner membrane protein
MYRTGHYGAALLVYAPAGAIAIALGFETLALAGGAVAVWGAKLPDVDLKLPLVSHRGVTHTVWFALLAGVVLGGVGVLVGANRGSLEAAGLAAFGATVGVLTIGSHILADALTPMGVRPFAPVSDREYSLALATADSPIANFGLLVLGIAGAALAFVAGTTMADLLA